MPQILVHEDYPLAGVSQRRGPENIPAEQSLLGAILANNRAFDLVASFLRPEHFAHPLHSRIYGEIAKRIVAGRVADAVTLRPWFEGLPEIREIDIGGVRYLANLLTAMVGILNAGEYGRAVYQAWQRRQLLEAGVALVDEALAAERDPGELLATHLSRLDPVVTSSAERVEASFAQTAQAVIAAADEAARAGRPIGLCTGMASVDEALGGLEPGTLTILAGRPGMGKSSLSAGWCVAIARRGDPVCEMSLEMSAEQLVRQALGASAGVSVAGIRAGRISQYDVESLVLAQREIGDIPLYIRDARGLTPGVIALKARALKRRRGIKLLVVDHMHIVRAEAGDIRAGAPYAVGQVAVAFQQLAADLGIPVLVLAQLSRAPEQRDDHRPTMADLRYAGDIEQCADVVMFLYRPEYYLPKSPPERRTGQTEEKYQNAISDWHNRKQDLKGRAELIFDKVRYGAPRVVPLQWHGETTSFSEG